MATKVYYVLIHVALLFTRGVRFQSMFKTFRFVALNGFVS